MSLPKRRLTVCWHVSTTHMPRWVMDHTYICAYIYTNEIYMHPHNHNVFSNIPGFSQSRRCTLDQILLSTLMKLCHRAIFWLWLILNVRKYQLYKPCQYPLVINYSYRRGCALLGIHCLFVALGGTLLWGWNNSRTLGIFPPTTNVQTIWTLIRHLEYCILIVTVRMTVIVVNFGQSSPTAYFNLCTTYMQ